MANTAFGFTHTHHTVHANGQFFAPDGEIKSSKAGPPPIQKPTSRRAADKDIICLNVGGARFEVARDTLMRYEGSMLASLVSGNWKEGDGGEEEIFIDRDGQLFKYILEYLRSDCVHLSNYSARAALLAEFDYFGIDADTSKIHMLHDYAYLHKLKTEIINHQARIKRKEQEAAAILESYRLAMQYSECVQGWGMSLMQLPYMQHVDKDLLRDCMLSRGLQVVKYDVKTGGLLLVHLVPL